MVELPEDLYTRLERRAAEAQHSVSDEIMHLLTEAMPAEGDRLPPGLEQELARMETLDDASLRKVARRWVSTRTSRRMESLNFKRQSVGLNRAERRVAEQLLEEFDRHMLVRSQALMLLKQRGHNISEFLSRPRRLRTAPD
ncbi:MAG: hypothetical protein ACRDJE_10580 [Dehalococcoidia bacterium]